MAVIAIIVVGVGLVVFVIGVIVSLVDWHRQSVAAKAQKMETHPLGMAENINAIRKLVIVLSSKPLGMQLMAFGIVVMLIGGALGGVTALTG